MYISNDVNRVKLVIADSNKNKNLSTGFIKNPLLHSTKEERRFNKMAI